MAPREVNVTNLWALFLKDEHTLSRHTPHAWKNQTHTATCVQTPTRTRVLYTQNTHTYTDIHPHPKRWQ